MAFTMTDNTEETNTGTENNGSPVKPRRNLAQTFDALCVDKAPLMSPIAACAKQDVISPTGVADLPVEHTVETSVPVIELYTDLKRELSDFVVNRVSCYSLIHDINKEAGTLASHDPLIPSAHAGEEASPLVEAVVGQGDTQSTPVVTPLTVAAIDEEQWLLDAITGRTPEEISRLKGSCPSTFSQAMGEKEYENPVSAVTGHARTQLWKPSRSWWEAKSGKNPWIEPTSHNKRWRYLWPLIHYHKFLAKCIKRLKRNAVDVKVSLSPVAVFLREEVCAVSDHLAAVSLFDSDEWMAALQHFNGWSIMSEEAEESYRQFVAMLKLRPINEVGDVDSPVLRSQIDQNLLRTMALQRDQLNQTDQPAPAKVQQTPSAVGGPPPAYPRSSTQPPSVPKQIHGVRRPRHFHPHPQGWWNGWEGPAPHPAVGDGSSVHSGLSVDSFSQRHQYDYGMYHPMPGYYGLPPVFPGSDTSQSTATGGYNPYNQVDPHGYPQGWVDPAAMGYGYPPQPMQGYYGPPPPQYPPPGMPQQTETPEGTGAFVQSPGDKPSQSNGQEYDQSQSPYWGHLDQATMVHIATPAKVSPSTPRRGPNKRGEHEFQEESKEAGFAINAQPPLIRHQYYYNGPYGPQDGYAPPSPATQFMMSPQSNFGYHGYGQASPRRFSARGTPRSKRTPTHHETIQPVHPAESPPAVTKPEQATRESPATVETTAESESAPDPST